MLNVFICDHERTDFDIFEASGDADIDNDFWFIQGNAKLSGHGCVDFSNAAGNSDDIVCNSIETDACYRLDQSRFIVAKQ